MKFRKTICTLLVLAAIICCISPATLAVNHDTPTPIQPFSTGNFSLTVPANTTIDSNSTLPLDDGDTVVIRATFTPPSASVDFGIIAPNGQFYYVNVTGGVADITINITRRGNYTFAICNNSSGPISVSGYINY